MKSSSMPTLSFLLLFAFFTSLPLLAFSNDAEPVFDTDGKPVTVGRAYYILPAIWGPFGGGLSFVQTGNSRCSVTVLQYYSEVFKGLPVKFLPRTGRNIFTNIPVEIEFTVKPGCASSSKWSVFVDNGINERCVGIGGKKDHPGEKVLSGTFTIKKSIPPFKSYIFVFCESGAPFCWDIGRYDNNERGKRLYLSESMPFDVHFTKAPGHHGTNRSVAE